MQHYVRRYFSRHAKSNSIDADALTKLAITDPDGLRFLKLARTGKGPHWSGGADM
jgi:hypothetical protein